MIKKKNIEVKNLVGIIISLLSIMLFPGCQKVINVDLNEAAPKIVIEGLINDRRGPYSITITLSLIHISEPTRPY